MTERCYIILTFFSGVCILFLCSSSVYQKPPVMCGWADQSVNAVSRQLISQQHAPAKLMALWGFSCVVYCDGPAVPETLLFPVEFICSDKSQNIVYSLAHELKFYVGFEIILLRVSFIMRLPCKHTCAPSDIWESVRMMFDRPNKIWKINKKLACLIRSSWSCVFACVWFVCLMCDLYVCVCVCVVCVWCVCSLCVCDLCV